MEEKESEAVLASKGAFVESLQRNNKKIRDDRAAAIARQAEIMYKRKIEDLETDKFNLETERNNMLDMSPADANSLILASDFDAKAFADKDLEIGVKIRNIDIQLDIAREQYRKLFIGE